MEVGVYTFGEVNADPAAGPVYSPEQRLANLLEEIELADQVGLDIFAVGEHHRSDYVISAPAVVLAAAAARTKSIRLSSAVTVLSSDDPVRVFQSFSTLDLISHGRAEIMAGRGSFIESFPLFGYDLDQYDALFEEKLDLLLKLRLEEKPHWEGHLRPSIDGRGIYPRPVQKPLPVWIAVGGSPQSVVRAGTLGLPLALAIIGGEPHRFAPLVELYREAGRRAGHDPASLKLGINSHGYIADDARQAADEFYPPYAAVMSKLGRERGWPPVNRSRYEAEISPRGAIVLGSPQEAIDKVMAQYQYFRQDRFLMQFSIGAMEHAKIMHAIELWGTKVAPTLRRETMARALATA